MARSEEGGIIAVTRSISPTPQYALLVAQDSNVEARVIHKMTRVIVKVKELLALSSQINSPVRMALKETDLTRYTKDKGFANFYELIDEYMAEYDNAMKLALDVRIFNFFPLFSFFLSLGPPNRTP